MAFRFLTPLSSCVRVCACACVRVCACGPRLGLCAISGCPLRCPLGFQRSSSGPSLGLC